jgi:L-ectoine synthase
MIVRRLTDIEGTSRDVNGGAWTSRRLLLASDGLSFGLHDTLVRAGAELEMQYFHHVEAVYCIAGRGTVQALPDGEVHPLSDGTLYALDRHDRHLVRAETDLRMVCVFDPPLAGPEVHDEDGAFPRAT